ncbi:MAG: magnesium/cobalt transporter CorA [Oligoflexales bacterium]
MQEISKSYFLRPPPGSAPGTLIETKKHKVHIDLIAYNEETFVETEVLNIKELEEMGGIASTFPVTWLNVVGHGPRRLVQVLEKQFNIHALAQEDLMNLYQRPKVEVYSDHFLVFFNHLDDKPFFSKSQIGVVVGHNFILSFLEKPVAAFDAIKERLRNKIGKIRSEGSHYLMYAIIDAAIDAQFPVAENANALANELENKILAGEGGPNIIRDLHRFKVKTTSLYQIQINHREMLNSLIKAQDLQIKTDISFYLRDCYDHIMQILDYVDHVRHSAENLMNLHLLLESNRTNEVMRVLTIIACIFLPLTFITGLYGMNFNRESPWNMPELDWTYGYPYALCLMSIAVLSLLYFFHRKGWVEALSLLPQALRRNSKHRQQASDLDERIAKTLESQPIDES